MLATVRAGATIARSQEPRTCYHGDRRRTMLRIPSFSKISDVTVYQDDAVWTRFYLVPSIPTIRRDDQGRPIFLLTIFHTSDESREGTPDAPRGGGFMNFDVQFAVDEGSTEGARQRTPAMGHRGVRAAQGGPPVFRAPGIRAERFTARGACRPAALGRHGLDAHDAVGPARHQPARRGAGLAGLRIHGRVQHGPHRDRRWVHARAVRRIPAVRAASI